MSFRDLKQFAPFAELHEEELELLEELLESKRLVRGQPLQREDGEGEGLVLVDSGCLRFETRDEGVLGRLGPGGAFGGLSLAALGSRAAAAVAEEETHLRVFSRSAFHRLADDSPRAACRILEATLREVAETLRGGLPRLRGG